MAGSGVKVGPAVTRAWCAGSNCAPWHGQKIIADPASYSTVQPAWVHTASYATTDPNGSLITSTGSPLAGSTAATAVDAVRSVSWARSVPAPVKAVAEGAAEAAGVG